jgi:hypothetical protein
MKHSPRWLIALSAVGIVASAQADIDVQGGLWEIRNHIEMTGLPVKIPDSTITQCIDKTKIIPKSDERINKYCTVTDQKIEGDTVSWKMSCKNNMTSEGSVTYHGTTFTGTINSTIEVPNLGTMTMTIQATGKRIGECTKEK